MQNQLLLVQSISTQTITVAQGAVPVITFDQRCPYTEIGMAINFLRSGAPTVQCILDYPQLCRSEIEGLLMKLSLSGETLFLHGSAEAKGEVVEIRRTVEQ